MQEEIKKIIFDELKKGTPPEKIKEMAISAGLSPNMIDSELASISMTDVLSFLNPFSKSQSEKEKEFMATHNLSKKKYWDPVGQDISEEIIDGDIAKVSLKYEEYKSDPGAIKRNLFYFSLPAIITVVLMIIFPQILESLLNSNNDSLGLLLLPIAPIVWYVHHVFAIQTDIIKLMIAKSEGWLYSPNKKPEHWLKFAGFFPEFFNKGDDGQNMQDEFWGTFDGKRQKVDFWTGLFEYATRTRDSKGNKRRTTHTMNAMALKLNKTLKTDFRLEPEGFFAKLRNFFGSKEIEMESHDFNKAFAFYYNGKKADGQLEIVKLVSPAVQVRLLEMKKNEGNFSLMFRGDAVIFLFKGKLLKKRYTNFFRKVEVDPRDIEYIKNRLNQILEISSDIVPFLD